MFRFLLLSLMVLPAGAQKKTWTEEEVLAVHRSALLIDGHNDVTSRTVRGWDIGSEKDARHTSIAKLRAGGVGAQFFAAYVSADLIDQGGSARRALEMIDTIRHDIVGRYPGQFVLALTADQIEAAHRAGKIAALIGIEGGHAIENEPRLLRAFYDLGARYMTLTHTRDLPWAGSSAESSNRGLSDLGRRIIEEMNRLGMMVDVAHVSDRTFWDVIEASRAPVFSSHSSARALSRIPRNMSDEMIRAVAKKGGLVMINLGCEFISQRSADTSPWIHPELGKNARCEQATLDEVVAHFEHIRKIAGVDFVGLGSDFDGVSCTPKGLEDVSQWPNLTRRLLEKGFSPEEIRKIYGGNFLRFLRAVERTAQDMRLASGVATR